jgi:type III pantothenate kinase
MLLAIDVGNTNTVLGLMPESGEPSQSWRLSSRHERTADEWRGLLDPILGPHIAAGDVDHAILGSVVPAVTGPLTTLCRQWLGMEPLIVSAQLDLGVTLGQHEPHSVGVDRLANAAAAWHLIGDACIVVDLGTATKLEAIDASGVFRGGVIAPGLGVSRDALAQRAARLFAVELTAPAAAIGRDTVSAVQSGLVLGHARMIEGLIADLAAELGHANPAVLLTGGHAFAIMPLLRVAARSLPNLTLDGLRLIHARNPRS